MKPPQFNDPLPVDPSTGGALRGEHPEPAPGAEAAATAPSTPLPEAQGPVLPAQDLTPEESAAVAQALFVPTIRRMGILLDTLISQSGNGDFGLWVPLAVIDAHLTTLPVTAANRDGMVKYLTLVETTLMMYAGRFQMYLVALRAWDGVGTPPPFPSWETNDTLQMYDMTEAATTPGGQS